MKITFLGAADTVTRSKHLVQAGDAQVLLDCGLFQGFKTLRERNWAPPAVPVKDIDAVVLSHALPSCRSFSTARWPPQPPRSTNATASCCASARAKPRT